MIRVPLQGPYSSLKSNALINKKGFILMVLVIFAESVAVNNAVTFWSRYQDWFKQHDHCQQQQRSDLSGNSLSRSFVKIDLNPSLFPVSECYNDIIGGSGEYIYSSNISSAVPLVCQLCNPPSNHNQGQVKSHHYPELRMHLCVRPHVTPIDKVRRVCTDNMINVSMEGKICAILDIYGGHIAGIASETTTTVSSSRFWFPHSPLDLPLNLWKGIFQVGLTTLNVMCWLIPLRYKNISENNFTLSLANAFSGGVFLSLAFGHLIPECIDGFGELELVHNNKALPYMVVLGGYLLMFFVEKVAFDTHDFINNFHEEHNNSPHKDVKMLTNGLADTSNTQRQGDGSCNSAVILLGALGVHSILEMAALGLARTFGDSALLSFSFALHQPAESIALLVAFLKSGMPKDQITLYLSVFSTMGPIGVVFGMAVKNIAVPAVDSIVLAIVAGTFIYIGATEVIPEEWDHPEHKWKKFFALISGIASIYFITQYTENLRGNSM